MSSIARSAWKASDRKHFALSRPEGMFLVGSNPAWQRKQRFAWLEQDCKPSKPCFDKRVHCMACLQQEYVLDVGTLRTLLGWHVKMLF